ncbi:MAG: ParB/RepB/Spo0J family partition protein [Clostridiales Family XIII bacterium]|jgi:ParB family chromosome partitioning protein|nr:ParB/RepB/Spo0J family partition protein [Clostridiales Family XIII bacterium]
MSGSIQKGHGNDTDGSKRLRGLGGISSQKGLGKGLEDLFADTEVSVEPDEIPKNGINYIEIHDIKPNAVQPRKYFSENAIDELAESIKEHGVIQPLIVRAAGEGYELVAGERRWRAAKKAGLKEVPCLLREITDEQNILIALIENMLREDLNPIEEAEAIKQAIDSYGITQEAISKSIGKSRPYIANAMRLLRLPPTVKRFLTDGILTGGHGKAIASVQDPEKQEKLAIYLAENGCSVREAEKLAADPSFGEPKKTAKPRPKNHAILAIEEELRTILGTKVSINNNGDKGKIELNYYSRDELDGLIETLRMLK